MSHFDESKSAESAQALLTEPEPWEPWETALVGWSLGIAFAGLLLLGWLINNFVLD